MLVGIPRPDGGAQPILVPGNPVRIHTAPGPLDVRVPWLGEHTDEVLREELGLPKKEIAALRAAGVVA
jgi:formyl-CoA transferase